MSDDEFEYAEDQQKFGLSIPHPEVPNVFLVVREVRCHRQPVDPHKAHSWLLGDNDTGEEETVWCDGKSDDWQEAKEFAERHNALQREQFHARYGDFGSPEIRRAEREQASKPGREVQRWADRAMYEAAPIDATDGPRVYLLSMTADPLGAIAAACKMYKGEVVRDLARITDAERIEFFEQVQKTKLKAPFEFVKFHFMIEGVTRALTHQMVRQRTAVYAQESLRFAVKSDMPVALPPSLQGLDEDEPENYGKLLHWNSALDHIKNSYQALIDAGVPAEDARGLLPHNVLTRLHYSTDLRALLDHAGNRLCTQAQFEWRLVFARIIEAIRSAHVTDWEDADGTTGMYMANELLSAFKPVCFQTGKCEFKANFDRHCSIRERVDFNESHGIPSSEWGEEIGENHGAVPDGWRPIKPGEWLLDSTAAREQ